MTIIQADLQHHREVVRDLFAEYLRWVCSRIYQEYKAVFDPETILASDMDKINVFLPPQGILLLSYDNEEPAGCACVRTLRRGIAELKRMYVRPDHRRKGIGTELVQETIRRLKALGCSELRLDSAGFMSDAHRVYRSMGFKDTLPYEESEIPKDYWEHWVFMKLSLQ